MRILPSPFKRTERIRFTPDGGTLIGSGIGVTPLTPAKTTRGMAIWGLNFDDEPECFLRGKGVSDFLVLPGGEKLLIDLRQAGMARFDLPGRREEATVKANEAFLCRGHHPDGSRFVEVGFPHRYTRRSTSLLVGHQWKEAGGTLQTWTQPLEPEWRTRFLGYSPGGESILLLESKNVGRRTTSRFQRRSAESGEVLDSALFARTLSIEALASPDQTRLALLAGHEIVCGSFDGFDRTAVRIENDTASHFSDMAFHPSSRILAAASNDQTIKFYETDSWTLLGTFTWNSGKMRSVAFSPDGTVAAAGSSTGQVVLWDVDF